jgi:hypothetical protein
MGDVHRCELYPEDLQTSSIPSDKQARGLGEAVVYRASTAEPTF